MQALGMQIGGDSSHAQAIKQSCELDQIRESLAAQNSRFLALLDRGDALAARLDGVDEARPAVNEAAPEPAGHLTYLRCGLSGYGEHLSRLERLLERLEQLA